MKARFLIWLKLPGLPKPPGSAEKPLVLVPGLAGEAGFHPKPESVEMFVTLDFNIVPAVVVFCNTDIDVSAPESIDFTNLFQSEFVGTCQPSGHNFRESLTAYQLYK
jgi:hypothetical protein